MNEFKPAKTFSSFSEFYPFYLSEHQNKTCRNLHYMGSSLSLCLLGLALFSRSWQLLWGIPILGYGFAWVGHLVFEKNRPATFRYPIYSFIGDWVMYYQFITGKIR